MSYVQEVQEILDHWNTQKFREQPNSKTTWHIRREVKYDLELAVTTALKHFTVDDIKGAIDNYALVILGQDYFYDYDKWTIDIFLTRKEKDDRNMFRWWRWLPGRFEEEDFLRDSVVKQRVQARRQDGEIQPCDRRPTFKEIPIEEAAALYEKGTPFMKNLFGKTRPEILEYLKKKPKGE